jgi:hypothetical protein
MLALGRSRSFVLVLVGGLGAALLMALALGGVGDVGAGGVAPVVRSAGLSRMVGAERLVPGFSSRFSSTYRRADGRW